MLDFTRLGALKRGSSPNIEATEFSRFVYSRHADCIISAALLCSACLVPTINVCSVGKSNLSESIEARLLQG